MRGFVSSPRAAASQLLVTPSSRGPRQSIRPSLSNCASATACTPTRAGGDLALLRADQRVDAGRVAQRVDGVQLRDELVAGALDAAACGRALESRVAALRNGAGNAGRHAARPRQAPIAIAAEIAPPGE